MTPRKTILRELNAAGPDTFRRPNEIRGFEKQAPKYREAVNGLLRDQLIRGTKGPDGNLVIGLNAQRLEQVQREIRPWFRAPLTWVVMLGAVASAALLLS